jgi:hypothetical protein
MEKKVFRIENSFLNIAKLLQYINATTAAVHPPLCKDKKNLANNVHVSRIFCIITHFYPENMQINRTFW